MLMSHMMKHYMQNVVNKVYYVLLEFENVHIVAQKFDSYPVSLLSSGNIHVAKKCRLVHLYSVIEYVFHASAYWRWSSFSINSPSCCSYVLVWARP